jgi:hypothetical protein
MKGIVTLSEQNGHALVFLYLPDKHINVRGQSHLSRPETVEGACCSIRCIPNLFDNQEMPDDYYLPGPSHIDFRSLSVDVPSGDGATSRSNSDHRTELSTQGISAPDFSRETAQTGGDNAILQRVAELLGRYFAFWKDKGELTVEELEAHHAVSNHLPLLNIGKNSLHDVHPDHSSIPETITANSLSSGGWISNRRRRSGCFAERRLNASKDGSGRSTTDHPNTNLRT